MLARKALFGLGVLMVVAVATPAMAGDEFKGWYGTLDLALTQPVGLDQHYGNEVGGETVPEAGNHDWEGHVTRLILDNDDAFTWGAAFGYGWGKMGSLQVSYWGFGNNDSLDRRSTNEDYFYPTVAGYTSDIAFNSSVYAFPGRPLEYTAEGDSRAKIWDIDYIRPIATGEKFSVDWVAGLRVAQYRENRYLDLEGTYSQYNNYEGEIFYLPVPIHLIQKHRQQGEGWGLKVGAIANLNFTKHLGLVADLSLSFLQAQTKGTIVHCVDSCTTLVAAGKDTLEGHDDSQRAEIRDYGLKAVWHQGPVDIFIGFKSSNWEGIVSDPIPPLNFSAQTGADSRSSVAFNSWHVGAMWKIGG